ncbi:hypothetical protein Tco_1043702 [Tanacetum coccineum]|uniref:Uncharacterized protein n=1 Tax=Tanacetum coccineum TaxID=301880 RepID=A0ABQ5GPU1_9ASTR
MQTYKCRFRQMQSTGSHKYRDEREQMQSTYAHKYKDEQEQMQSTDAHKYKDEREQIQADADQAKLNRNRARWVDINLKELKIKVEHRQVLEVLILEIFVSIAKKPVNGRLIVLNLRKKGLVAPTAKDDSYYFLDKPQFISILQKEWSNQVHGCEMFRLVKNLKALKYHLKNLNWKHGNLYENAQSWREKLKEIQRKVDQDPNNVDSVEEMSMNCGLFKNKVSDDDANHMFGHVSDAQIKLNMFNIDDNKAPGQDGYTSKFYKKSLGYCGSRCVHVNLEYRTHKSKVEVICNENGDIFKGIEVAEQFVKQFKTFLGQAALLKR